MLIGAPWRSTDPTCFPAGVVATVSRSDRCECSFIGANHDPRKPAALAIIALLTAPLAGVAQPQEFTRLDVLALVNRDARNWMLNADDVRLDIDTVRIPKAAGEQGKVCGPIVSLRRNADPRAPRSYIATLWIERGQLVVGGMSTFFMGVEELLASDLCR